MHKKTIAATKRFQKLAEKFGYKNEPALYKGEYTDTMLTAATVARKLDIHISVLYDRMRKCGIELRTGVNVRPSKKRRKKKVLKNPCTCCGTYEKAPNNRWLCRYCSGNASGITTDELLNGAVW